MGLTKNAAKRPWKRSEKLLFLAPLLMLGVAGFAYVWQGARAVEVAVSGAPMEWQFSPDGRFIAVEHQIKYVNSLSVYNAKTGALEVDLGVPKTGLPKSYAEPMHFAWASDSKSLAAGYFDLQTGTRTYSTQLKKQKNFVPKLVVWDFPSGAMRGYWPAANPSEFADTPKPQFIKGNTKIWSEALPPSLFDAKTGQKLRVFGAKDANNKWQIDANSKRELAKMRSEIARDSPLNFNADVEIETKYNSKIAVGELENKQAQLRNSKTGQFWPVPKHLYADQVDLAHRTRKVALTDWSSRSNSQSSRNIESSRLIVWDFAAGHELWRRNAKIITGAAWSNSDRLIAWVESKGGGADKENFYVADAETGKTLWQMSGRISNPVWSPDDKRIAYEDWGILKIVNLPNGLIETTP